MQINVLKNDEAIPYELLMLADPSKVNIDSYIHTSQCYVAQIDNQVVGIIVTLEQNKQTLEIMNISVLESYQGKGIGKKLISYVLEEAKEYNYQVIMVGTGNSSLNQLAFYQKCGFRIVEVIKDYFTIHYEDVIFEQGIQCRDMLRLELKIYNS